MATKRFTDTEKWKDPFFDVLTNDYKLVWLYLLDDCDNAGVFSVNIRRLNFSCNTNLTPEDILVTFGDRLHLISEEKWLITSFMSFQYGPGWSTSGNKAVVSARTKLEALGLLTDENRLSIDNKETINRLSIDNKETINRPKDKDKDESKEMVESKVKVESKIKVESKVKNEPKSKLKEYLETLTLEEKKQVRNLPDNIRKYLSELSSDEQRIQAIKIELLKLNN